MPADFMADFGVRLAATLAPGPVPPAADIKASVTIAGILEYEGEHDQTTSVSLDVSVTGYDESGNVLWNYYREYEGSTAPMALLAAMAQAQQPDTDMTKAPAYKTEASTDGHEYRGGYPR